MVDNSSDGKRSNNVDFPFDFFPSDMPEVWGPIK